MQPQQQQQQQQPDSAAAAAAARKMAHPALLPRAGGGSLEEPQLPAAAPPQSLALVGPSGVAAAAAAAQQQQQLKKKSGFQITSVTAAAAAGGGGPGGAPVSASLSSSNSVAEDTESYDDLDESHTEDLSSSELLDASLSRATDRGPERSSSEETLSNCHDADTPGALSPNQPRAPAAPHLNGAPHPAPRQPLAQPHRAAAMPPPAAGPLPTRGAPGNGPATPSGGSGPAVASGGASRFRVVKLDSSSEPFRKGRWTCTEFYDKEGLEAGAPLPPSKAGHHPPDNTASERDSTSGSSVSSVLSTLSHYTESAGSGDMGALASQLPTDQAHQAGSHPSQATVPPQQLPYVQPAPPVPVAAQLPQLSYGGPGHVKAAAANPNPLPATDYAHPQQMLPAPVSSVQPGAPVVGTGTPLPAAPPSSGQPSGLAHLPVAPTQPVACAQMAVGTGVQMMSAAPPAVPQTLVANPMAPPVMPQNAAPSQAGSSIPTGVILPGSQASTSNLPQPLVMASHTTLLPAQPQLQPGESLVPGVAGQQGPAVSPGAAIGAVPISGHCALPPVGLAPSQSVALSSGVQNEGLVQKLPQSSLTAMGIHLPMSQNSALNAAQFAARALAQSSAGRGEEARRSADPFLVGIASAGIPSALLDGSGSMAASLFPLKGLPLTAQLMDGEDDGSSGATVVAIDNKIEQAMDLVKSHLMYAVREEVEVLKEQIKELIEKNSQLEQENSLLKTLASPEQLAQFQAQLQTSSSPAPSQPQGTGQPLSHQPPLPGSGPSA
ncbi:TSC22 domain family protein 1 isoform X2 [Sphaerodactylus townsendi]|uniref:TSC22 domain family protein 1 isoform X2 n=1 Tax=Sphaerodactylus townsendi TaxID=933632 RepID=UPI0020271DD3|nr:TSC22 domain family protein 1 isoform X2 [Sphaerodactylus townsendi]